MAYYRSPFEDLLLDDDQKQLFCVLVDAFRSVPKSERREFFLVQTLGGTYLMHQGLPGGRIDAYEGDLTAIAEAGLLRISYGSRGTARYDITPTGFRFFEYARGLSPMPSVEKTLREFLGSDAFIGAFPTAHERWAKAAERLWAGDSPSTLTEVGHLCREAMQLFVVSLAQRVNVPPDPNPQRTVSTLRAVIAAKVTSQSEVAFFDALLAYWGTVSDLVQRQEHGATKEGEQLEWDDARRVVFHTGIVMFEVTRACV